MMPTIHDLVQELEQEAKATRRVLEHVPENRLGWKPHDKSLTLGQLAMHVATIPARIAELSTQPGLDVSAEIPRPAATSTAELVTALDESIARAKTVLLGMDDAALQEPWKMFNGNLEVAVMPRGQFLRTVMLNHWYHHRGQLTVYLRQTGALVPAVYGSSADEHPLLK
jgi:uncharacterized damage-inducible protein DinB